MKRVGVLVYLLMLVVGCSTNSTDYQYTFLERAKSGRLHSQFLEMKQLKDSPMNITITIPLS
ncbi:hypothetical protein A9C19_13405 [Bacillus weihaiensis]|uniref:Lipoprotein n=1 Tax=Bacillus weihaiensis TaxID=1547283 RepID=A0A1L3MTK4_9BACI|nr:hypothetical protein A9C19_13405 [Bacillus weihaiensis]